MADNAEEVSLGREIQNKILEEHNYIATYKAKFDEQLEKLGPLRIYGVEDIPSETTMADHNRVIADILMSEAQVLDIVDLYSSYSKLETNNWTEPAPQTNESEESTRITTPGTTSVTTSIPESILPVRKVNLDQYRTRFNLTDSGDFTRDMRLDRFDLPGYIPCHLRITVPVLGQDGTSVTEQTKLYYFLVSPDQVSETRTNNINPHKTGGGYFIMRTGPGLIQMALSGYMLDTLDMRERTTFLEAFFKPLMQDQLVGEQSANVNNLPVGQGQFRKYINDNKVELVIEGYRYTGHILSLNLTKSSMQQFLYRYNITMLVTDDTHINPRDTNALQAYTTDGLVHAYLPPSKRDDYVYFTRKFTKRIVTVKKQGEDSTFHP